MSNTLKQSKKGQIRTKYSLIAAVFFLVIALLILPDPRAYANHCPIDCPLHGSCDSYECSKSKSIILDFHARAEQRMKKHIADQFKKHRQKLTANFLPKYFVPAIMRTTEKISAIIHHHAQAIGRLMDAKNQLETQKAFELMKFEAYKQYQPSETFCWLGTNVRSLHSAEAKAKFNSYGFNAQSLKQQLGKKNMSAAGSKTEALAARWENFNSKYCDPDDNNFTGGSTGLRLACTSGASEETRKNIDLKYTTLIENPKTIKVDFTTNTPSDESEDIIALNDNLYGHDSLTRAIPFMSTGAAQKNYFALRSIAAKRSVAQTSFSAIVGLKSEGNDANTKIFLQELVKGVGGNPATIGDKPSYFAQLEILAKQIYQNPHFYANLYDSPENIARKSTALKAIELMLERAISESETRQEMIMSVLLTSNLRGQVTRAEQRNQGE